MVRRNSSVCLTVCCLISIVFLNTLHGFPLEVVNSTLNVNVTSHPVKPIKRAIEARIESEENENSLGSAIALKQGIEPEGMLMFPPKFLHMPAEEKSTSTTIAQGKREKERPTPNSLTTVQETIDEELTISVPKDGDHPDGKFNDNPRAVTFGHVWLEYARNLQGVTGVTMAAQPARLYYPDERLSTVCRARTTIYNIPRVFDWLPRHLYNHTHLHRPIWLELRRELYKFGRSEECHVMSMDKWRDYEECTLRRHQRMEYMIPKYPLHQIGYYSKWSQWRHV